MPVFLASSFDGSTDSIVVVYSAHEARRIGIELSTYVIGD
jgi:hypothetical protein